MRGLGERVCLEQHSRGILSCPVKAHVWRSRYKIYRELAHGAAHRRWRRATDSPGNYPRESRKRQAVLGLETRRARLATSRGFEGYIAGVWGRAGARFGRPKQPATGQAQSPLAAAGV